MSGDLIVRLVSMTYLTESTTSFAFQASAGGDLPAFTAGAHIVIQINERLARAYSLINNQDERHRYVIAVQHEPRGLGGSRFLHSQARIGMSFRISPPVNDFPLEESASFSLFIAGGIGVTPIRPMIMRLESLGRPWRLIYAVRTLEQAIFRDDLAALGGRVELHAATARGGRADLAAAIAAAPPGAHVYGCGPKSMLLAFRQATARLPPRCVHLEQFAAIDDVAVAGGFVVELARSDKKIQIQPGETILDALLGAGISAPYSCQQGVCGTCETAVLGGTPDHRDSVLSPAERAANKSIMTCCSGALSDRLVLDL